MTVVEIMIPLWILSYYHMPPNHRHMPQIGPCFCQPPQLSLRQGDKIFSETKVLGYHRTSHPGLGDGASTYYLHGTHNSNSNRINVITA